MRDEEKDQTGIKATSYREKNDIVKGVEIQVHSGRRRGIPETKELHDT